MSRRKKTDWFPIEPHGGKLVVRYKKRPERIPNLPRIKLTRREWCDIQLIATGALSPLDGFMDRKNWRSCVKDMHLENGVLWSIPITLSVDDETRRALKGKERALLEWDGKVWGEIRITDIYKPNKELEAKYVYRTTSDEHPSVKYLKESGDWYVGGKISVWEIDDFGFPDEFLTPEQVRKVLKERGWKRVVGFQTRNPPHRAHEYIQKCALEICDGLFLNPLVGETKPGDVPADVRMKTYRVVVEKYYNRDRVLLVILPSAMRYGGPREAIHHAIIRQNYGCTHFIVGRDHAGVGNFYGPFDAHKIFDEIPPGALKITPLFFDNAFWCSECGGMASPKTCPHPEDKRVSISGTQARAMLSEGKVPPPEYMRPEVAKILIEYYSSGRR